MHLCHTTLGGGTLAIDGTAAVILLIPMEATITEVAGQAGRQGSGRERCGAKAEPVPSAESG
jgi:hypothetical protein